MRPSLHSTTIYFPTPRFTSLRFTSRNETKRNEMQMPTLNETKVQDYKQVLIRTVH
jgi:hypothetical protein